jgi:UBX domain-containing protein 1
VRKLTFWKTGFTIDDGPLQSYDDPANKAFLVAINSGKAPLDRLNVKPGQPVELAVERRLHEDYKPPPPPPVKPFSGAGQRLGK